MKIVKRDGRIVDYDSEKIRIAIKKANSDVEEIDQIKDSEIEKIIKSIEKMKKKRLLVEDIQDIIEKKLVELNKYELSKTYMLYRYERELIRKANNTEESILTLIKNSRKENNKNAFIVASQRDLIAGEVSKDLTKRILLPEEISKSHEKGILYFHDSEYFLQPMFSSSYVNISDMLENGFVMNNIFIESPKSFKVACTVLTQIIARIGSSQYGSQTINIKHLSKYLKKSEDRFKKLLKKENSSILKTLLKEELSSGIQTLEYQINTLITANGKSPKVSFFLELDETDPFLDYTKLIIEEILNQRIQGVKSEDGEMITLNYPKLIYCLDESNSLKKGKFDFLTNLALSCLKIRQTPSFVSAKIMKEYFDGKVFGPVDSHFLPLYKDKNKTFKVEGRFDQGSVSLNLVQIAIESSKDEEKFFEILDNRLELCYEALMCRYHSLLGTLSDVSPIEFQHGAVARLEKKEPIDKLLKNGYSTLSLEYAGLVETVKYMKETDETTSKIFTLKLLKTLKNKCNNWKKETGIAFTLIPTRKKEILSYFLKMDKEAYGIVKGITDKDFYTNSFKKCSFLEKIQLEKEFQTILKEGEICNISIKDIKNIEEIIPNIYENILYTEFTKEEDIC